MVVEQVARSDRGRYVLRTDGTREDQADPIRPGEIAALIGAPDGCDVVALRHLGEPLHVMVVDDTAALRRPAPPINVHATRLYLANCWPGTDWVIRGDVYVCRDDDHL